MCDEIPCRICERPTNMVGTRLCNPCWEMLKGINSFIGRNPAAAIKFFRIKITEAEMIIDPKNKNRLNSFRGYYDFLSNFHPVDVVFDCNVYPSVEHAFQAAKTLNTDLREMIRVLPKDQAGKAKKLGRELDLRTDWDIVKVPIMWRLLTIKFSLQKYRKLLLDTRPKQLVEGNWWHDNFWGDCSCRNCSKIIGLNTLGKLLMKIRDEKYENFIQY